MIFYPFKPTTIKKEVIISWASHDKYASTTRLSDLFKSSLFFLHIQNMLDSAVDLLRLNIIILH